MSEPLTYIYILRPVRAEMPHNPTPEESHIVGVHFNYLKAAFERGDAVFIGRSDDESPIGITVFKAESEAAAQQFMDNDPAVVGGVMTAELRPFRIVFDRG